jgi:hypothetical protein
MHLPLDRQSERFSATGSIAAEGVKNQLGRPHLGRLAVLVREAVQNSWDAREEDAGGVTFGISSWVATTDQLEVLRKVVFPTTPPKLELAACLASDHVRVMVVYDRGTNGLGGPTRADVAPEPGETTDFVDFLRNIGQPPDRDFGGGTYGFGKAAFYLASKARTILVHTRCSVSGNTESRFIAAALGSQYEDEAQVRFTGRHWWGRFVGGVAEPLVGAEADEVAYALGMPSYPADGKGTSILLIQPDFEGAPEAVAIGGMRDAILRYFWPKWVDGPAGTGTMKFEMALDGVPVEIPRPESVQELTGFVAAFRGLIDPTSVEESIFGGRVQDLECQRPRQRLGKLSIVRFPASEKREWGAEGQAELPPEEPFGRPTHHVALLRNPNFVVRYLAGPSTPSSRIEYGGVFRTERDIDTAFATAEPPTHDDWIPDAMENGPAKTYVRVALRRLREAVRDFAAPPAIREPAGLDLPLGALSDQLGGLIPTEHGIGAGQQDPDRERSGGGARGSFTGGQRPQVPQHGRVRVLEGSQVQLVNGRPALIVPFEVQHGGGEPLIVEVDAGVLLEGGGIEIDPPTGAERAAVLEWRGPDGNTVGAVSQCTIPPDLQGRWSVVVSIPPDAMISVSVASLRRQVD